MWLFLIHEITAIGYTSFFRSAVDALLQNAASSEF
jgi:hypothetical protein